jgi:hypothetical protein
MLLALRFASDRVCAQQHLASNARSLVLARFAEPFQFLAAAPFAWFLVVSLAPHLFSQPASFAQFTKAAHRFLNRLASPHP